LLSRQRFRIEAEGVEGVEGRPQVTLDETLVFVYLRKLHHFILLETPTLTRMEISLRKEKGEPFGERR
jgi:hypothetical protein